MCKNHVARSKVKVTVSTYSLCVGFSETCLCPAPNFVLWQYFKQGVIKGSGFLSVCMSLCQSVNICDHPSMDPTVQVCDSKTLLDTLATLGTNIKYYQTVSQNKFLFLLHLQTRKTWIIRQCHRTSLAIKWQKQI